MAKRNKNKAANLMIMLISIVTAAISFLGLACKFINQKTTPIIGNEVTAKWNLSQWFDSINDMKDLDEIANWQTARWLLIVTTILLVVMLAMLIVRYFVKHPILNWATFGLGIAAAVCGALVMVMTLIGCGAMSGSVILGTIEYRASIGVYLFSIGAAVSGISAAIMALRK